MADFQPRTGNAWAEPGRPHTYQKARKLSETPRKEVTYSEANLKRPHNGQRRDNLRIRENDNYNDWNASHMVIPWVPHHPHHKTLVVLDRLFQPWNYWHFGPDNSLWGTVLCVVADSAASPASARSDTAFSSPCETTKNICRYCQMSLGSMSTALVSARNQFVIVKPAEWGVETVTSTGAGEAVMWRCGLARFRNIQVAGRAGIQWSGDQVSKMSLKGGQFTCEKFCFSALSDSARLVKGSLWARTWWSSTAADAVMVRDLVRWVGSPLEFPTVNRDLTASCMDPGQGWGQTTPPLLPQVPCFLQSSTGETLRVFTFLTLPWLQEN